MIGAKAKYFAIQRLRNLFTVLSILIAAAPAAHADEVIGIREAIQAALLNNHHVKSRYHGVVAAERELSAAQNAFLPKINIESKYTTGTYTSYGVFTRLNQETLTMANFFAPGTVSNFQTSLNLEQTVYVRELSIMKDIKKLSLSSAESVFLRFREELAFNVLKGYLAVIRAGSVKKLAEKSLDEAREVYRVAVLRVTAGVGLKSDELRAYVRMKDREAALIRAGSELLIAKKALSLLLADDRTYDVDEKDLELVIALPDRLHAVAAALEKRGDYLSDLRALDSSVKAADVHKSRYYPKMFLSGSYYNDGKDAPLGSDGDGYVVGLAFRWDLFDGTRSEELLRSRSEYLRQKEYLLQREREIKFQIEESWLRADDAEKRQAVAAESVGEAEESFRLLRLRYENNLSGLAELLDAELALYGARNAAVSARMEHHQARGELLLGAGLFLDSVMKGGAEGK